MPDTLLCHRCGASLTPGRGDFYVVRIEAVADPSPPDIQLDDVDLKAELEKLAEQAHDLPQAEMMDQVYRQLTIHLCGGCYRVWIEDPAGSLGQRDAR